MRDQSPTYRASEEANVISKLILRAVLLVVLTIGLLIVTQPLYADVCSNATLQGNYGLLVTGTAAGSPIAIMGQIKADGNGALTGFETISADGNVFDTVNLTGTYTIGSGCAGTATITPQGGAAANYNLAVASSAKVQLVGSDSGTVQSGFLKAQGTAACSPAGVKGTYGIAQSGDVVGQGPLAFGGQIRIRANGLLSGIRWGSDNGIITSGDAISGVYKIGNTCFGAGEISVNGARSVFYNLVVVDGGNTILFLQTDPGTVASGVWER